MPLTAAHQSALETLTDDILCHRPETSPVLYNPVTKSVIPPNHIRFVPVPDDLMLALYEDQVERREKIEAQSACRMVGWVGLLMVAGVSALVGAGLEKMKHEAGRVVNGRVSVAQVGQVGQVATTSGRRQDAANKFPSWRALPLPKFEPNGVIGQPLGQGLNPPMNQPVSHPMGNLMDHKMGGEWLGGVGEPLRSVRIP